MEEITVEASPIDPYLPARTVVDRSEIIDSHDSDLSDALQRTPGINVRDGGQGEPRVDMRGFDQRATLYTLNGVPIYEPYNGVVNVDLFPLEMLGNVEVTRGAASSLYGPNGMAGQVKLTTFGAPAPTAAASTIWRESDLWDVRASGGASRDGLSGFVAGRYLTSPNFTLSDGFDDRPPPQRRFQNGDQRLNSDIEQLSGFATLGYEYDGGRTYGAVLASDSTFGVPPSTTQFMPMFLRTDRERLLHVQGGIDQRLSPNVGVAGGLFYTGYNLHQSQYDGADFRNVVLKTKADSSELGGIGRVTVQVGNRDSLAIGGQVRDDGADISNTVRGTISKPGFTIGSAAIENLYAATDRISLVLGVSCDLLSGAGIATRSELNPQGVVAVDFGDWGETRIAAARKIRFPTLRELYDPMQGFARLRPETPLTYEIGHQLARRWGYAGLNLFRSDVDGLIDAGGADAQKFQNLDSATLQGIEMTAGSAPISLVRLDVTYTYLDTTARNNNGVTVISSAVQHKPAHRFNGTLWVFLPWWLVLRSDAAYTSSQLDQFGSVVTVDGFALWSVQLMRPVGQWLSVFAGVDNLLDADVEQKLGTPQPGRRVFAGVRATY